MSVIATRLLDFINDYEENGLDKNVNRYSNYGALTAFMQDTQSDESILTPEVRKNISNSFGSNVQVPVFDTKGMTITAVRNAVITADENDTALYSLNFVTYVGQFTMTPAVAFNNYVDYQSDFSQKMRRLQKALAESLDADAVTALDTAINQFFPANTFPYAVVANAFQVPLLSASDAYNEISTITQQMDFDASQINITASTSHQSTVNRFINQGPSNATNEQFQFGPYAWNFTNRIATGVGEKSIAYAIPSGNVAVVSRLDPDPLRNNGMGVVIGSEDNPTEAIQQTYLPLLGQELPVAVYYTSRIQDQSAVAGAASGGLTRTHVEGWQFSLDVCFMTPYITNPVTEYAPIIKLAFLA